VTAGRSAGTEQGQGRECDWDCALTGHAHCTTIGCDIPGTVWGLFDDGDTRQRVLYCSECARDLTESGEFVSSPSVAPARDSGLDEAREAVARELGRHQGLRGPMDDERPDVWQNRCECGWDDGDEHPGWRERYRMHIAGSIFDLPQLAALLRDGTTT
jgi:hypothetical protein